MYQYLSPLIKLHSNSVSAVIHCNCNNAISWSMNYFFIWNNSNSITHKLLRENLILNLLKWNNLSSYNCC